MSWLAANPLTVLSYVSRNMVYIEHFSPAISVRKFLPGLCMPVGNLLFKNRLSQDKLSVVTLSYEFQPCGWGLVF
jgi:hypothetical protein